MKIFLRPFISRWMARVDLVHKIQSHSVQHKALYTTVGAEEHQVAWKGSHPSNLAGSHTSGGSARAAVAPARPHEQPSKAISSRRAAPIPPPTPKMPRPLVPLVSAGACAPSRGRLVPRRAAAGGRRVRVRASAGAGEGTAPPRPSRTQVTVVLPNGFTDLHHVSARRRW
jgi:hypothetical protein